MEDLENGASFMVTIVNELNRGNIIDIMGGRRHSQTVVEGLFDELKRENRLAVCSAGIFEGCGQVYKLVK